ncbi:MAG: DUF2905 domain-containing protein [Calditrichia bacterium]
MRKIFIYLGILLIFIGLFWPWISKIPLGRLPGDIIIDKPNVKIYFPIVTMLLLSIILSLLLWFIRKFF